MYSMDEAQAMLEREGGSLEHYDPTVLVFVDRQLVADSESEDSAKDIVSRARSYGEEADFYIWKG